MSEKSDKPVKLVKPVPEDASDLSELWLDTGLGDDLTEENLHGISVGKPPGFFRVHPDKAFRRRTAIYTHKVERQIEETHYLVIGPQMRGKIDEARSCILDVVVDRAGTPRLWPRK